MPLHKPPRSVFWGWQTFKKLKEDWCTKATHLQISSIIDSWVNVRIIHCVYHLSIHLHPIFSHLPPCSRPVHYLQKSLEAKPHKDSCNGLISQNKKCKKCEQMWANATWPKKRWHWLAHFLASSRPHEKHKTRRGAEKIEKTEKAKARISEFRFFRACETRGSTVACARLVWSRTSLECAAQHLWILFLLSNDVKYLWFYMLEKDPAISISKDFALYFWPLLILRTRLVTSFPQNGL